jgi:NAD(P)H dehydrogenase (quinone)
MKILITGATGNLGSAAIDFLSEKTDVANISALVRNLDKAEHLKVKGIRLRTGDYENPVSLIHSFDGIDVLLLISTSATENRFEQHRNVIDAAKKSGVKHIVYTSILKASADSTFEPGIDHYQTERYLDEHHINYTIFRNAFYTEIVPMLMGDALQSGKWYYPAGEAKINFVSRIDIAEALANVLADPAGHVNKVYEIASDESYTFSEIAAMASEAMGKEMVYISIPLEAMKGGMRQSGMPEPLISLIASGADAIAKGELDITDHRLESILQRKPARLQDSLLKLLGVAG